MNVLREAKQQVPADLLKFDLTVRKKVRREGKLPGYDETLFASSKSSWEHSTV